MRVPRIATLMVALLVSTGLSGCGSGSNYREVPNLTGSYTGRFVQSTRLSTETGTMTVVIGPDHLLAGTVYNETTATDGTIVGDIESGLLLTATLTYPSDAYQLVGKVGKDETNTLVGVLSVRAAGGASVATMSIELDPTGSTE